MATVIGRNGFEYEAEHISGYVYKVGKFLVLVKETKRGAGGWANETICKATKANIARFKKREAIVG